jgi:hypothetical protein
MVVSFSQPHADLLLSIEAERWRSPAAESVSEERAYAVGSQVQPNVRRAMPFYNRTTAKNIEGYRV